MRSDQRASPHAPSAECGPIAAALVAGARSPTSIQPSAGTRSASLVSLCMNGRPRAASNTVHHTDPRARSPRRLVDGVADPHADRLARARRRAGRTTRTCRAARAHSRTSASASIERDPSPRAISWQDHAMNRDSARAAAAGAHGARGRARPARYVMGIDGGATKTLAAVLDLDRARGASRRGRPQQRGRRRRRRGGRHAARASPIARWSAPASPSASSTSVVLAVAGTDTPAIARHVCVGARRRLDRRQRRRRRVGRRDGRVGPASARSPAPAPTCSASGPTAGRGASAAGATCSATRAAATGSASESIRAALRDRDGSGPQTALSRGRRRVLRRRRASRRSPRSSTPSRSTKGEIAAFAVRDLRGSPSGGDAVAHELYARGAHELAAQIAAVIGQTGLAAARTSSRSA